MRGNGVQRPTALAAVKAWARALKRDVHALLLARSDPRVPWYAKALAIFVAGYALSPIDLIPDFIPILGYLDDVILVPAGIWLAVRLIPAPVMDEYRARAESAQPLRANHVAAAVVMLIWIAIVASIGWLLYCQLSG